MNAQPWLGFLWASLSSSVTWPRRLPQSCSEDLVESVKRSVQSPHLRAWSTTPVHEPPASVGGHGLQNLRWSPVRPQPLLSPPLTPPVFSGLQCLPPLLPLQTQGTGAPSQDLPPGRARPPL